jgi:chromosome partitioning protein
MMAQGIASSNQKGGVAKTTTCFSLGSCLAELGFRTLIVDLDSQSNLTIAVGLDPDEIEWSIADLLDHNRKVTRSFYKNVIQSTGMKGMDIIPSDLRLAGMEHQLFEREHYEIFLRQLLEPLEAEYDYILLDCPPSLGPITLIALSAADIVLIPIQCEYYAAQGLLRLMDIAEAICQRENPNLKVYFVVTMYDKRNHINREIYNQLKMNFSEYLLNAVIGIDTRLRESAALGEPVTLYAPRERASVQYRQLAQEIISICMSEDHKI